MKYRLFGVLHGNTLENETANQLSCAIVEQQFERQRVSVKKSALSDDHLKKKK